MYIFNILFLLSLGWLLVLSQEQNNSSSIYIFNYHSTVDNNRTNLTTNDAQNIKVNFTNPSIKSTDNDENKQTTFQPVYTAILNLTETKSLKQMEEQSFKPDFIAELPKEERQLTISKDAKRDLPTSESATILINSMNNSRMLNSQKITQLMNKPSTTNQAKNETDTDMLKFEDELDVQPHSFSIASRMTVNSTKSPVAETSTASKEVNTSTSRPVVVEEEESTGKKLKKKHLQMLQLKKKLKHNPDKFKAIKIRAPRLHLTNSTSKLFGLDTKVRKHKIGYASLVRTRNVNLTDYHLDDGLFIKKKRIHNRDQLDSSGSENRQIRLIMIHSYKKPSERFSKRILNGGQENNNGQLIGAGQTHHPIFVKLHANRRLKNNGGGVEESRPLSNLQPLNAGQSTDQQSLSNIPNMFSATYQSSSNRFIPKLLLPRFQRPKMYSLDGFIPRPNVQKFTTTTSSSLNVNNGLTQFQHKSGRKASDKQLDKANNDETSKRRKYKSKSSTNDLDDDLNTSGSATRKRQILFMKRKGFGFEEEVNSVKPKIITPEKKKNSNRKGLKAIDFQFPKANYPKELLESLNIRPEPPKFEYPSIRKDLINKDGKPSKTYPTFAEIPKTSFQCPENLSSGVFSDIETSCQVWHMCEKGTKHSFLCANGTVFNEKVGVCDHWYNVDCSPSNVNSVKLTKLY